jgi:hypothetical protein
LVNISTAIEDWKTKILDPLITSILKEFASLADPMNKANAIRKLMNNTDKWFGNTTDGWSTIGDLGTGEYEIVEAYVDALENYWNILSDAEREALFDKNTLESWKAIIDYGNDVIEHPDVYSD